MAFVPACDIKLSSGSQCLVQFIRHRQVALGWSRANPERFSFLQSTGYRSLRISCQPIVLPQKVFRDCFLKRDLVVEQWLVTVDPDLA